MIKWTRTSSLSIKNLQLVGREEERYVVLRRLPTRWISRVLFLRILGCYVTKFAPRKALKLFASGKLTFDERAVLHRVEWYQGLGSTVLMTLHPEHQTYTLSPKLFGDKEEERYVVLRRLPREFTI